MNNLIFFSVLERAVFYKSFNLIGSKSGQYSPIWPAHSGRNPIRCELSRGYIPTFVASFYKHILFCRLSSSFGLKLRPIAEKEN